MKRVSILTEPRVRVGQYCCKTVPDFRINRAVVFVDDGSDFAMQFASMSTSFDHTGRGHKLQSYILCRLVCSPLTPTEESANKLFTDSRTCPLCELALGEPDVSPFPYRRTKYRTFA